jgi:hypothetical protein
MGFKSFLSRSSRRPLVNNTTNGDVDNDNNNSANVNSPNDIGVNHNSNIKINSASAPKMGHKRNQSTRLVAGLQNMFNTHRRSKTVAPGSGPIIIPMSTSMTSPAAASLAPTATPRRSYRFQSPKQKVRSGDAYSMMVPLILGQKTDPIPSPPSTADATAIESEATLLSSPLPYSTPASSALTPASTAEYKESGPRIELGARVVTESNNEVDAVPRLFSKTRVDAAPTNFVDEIIDASPLAQKTSQAAAVEAGPAKSDTFVNEMEEALAGMRAAEKLLHERHAALHKPKANTSKKLKPNGLTIGKAAATAPVPAYVSTHRRKQSRTANEAMDVFQRRQAIKEMAYFAADGCPTNQDIIDLMNAHFALKSRHIDEEIPDVTFIVNGINILASQMPHDSIERNWILRYNIVVHNATQVERRLMNIEDHEMILTQLFPQDRAHLLKQEHFEIFMTGLGEEGILTKSQVATITKAQVITEEFDKGAHFTGPSVNRYAHRRNPTAIALFDIPRQARRPMLSYSPRPTKSSNQHELYYKLRILAEAAVYDQKFWKGYFFPSACSKLESFYDAWKTSQEGFLLPPSLTEYSRDWTHKEVRLMQRSHMICELLNKYETNTLTDFGIIRAIRATYVNIPAQPFWCAEDLESFLYHRIPDSGLDISEIPGILLMHPDHDAAAANARLKRTVHEALQRRAEEFEKEEQERLRLIGESYMTFEQQKKAEMSRWERVKAEWKSVFGKKEVVVPFDPFAPEHGASE